jgi:signal transduction histidine kinase
VLGAALLPGSESECIAVVLDVSARKKAEESLRRTASELDRSSQDLLAAQVRLLEAAKMESVGRLAAGVAHEVKNPLAIVSLGLSYVMRHSGSQDPELRGTLTDMAEAVERADTIVRGLLDFSARLELQPKRQSLNELVRKALALMRLQVARAEIRLEEALAPDLPDIEADGSRVSQVLVNVLLNALEATPGGGTISVCTGGPATLRVPLAVPGGVLPVGKAGVVLCIVEDTGDGASAEVLARAFDPFFTSRRSGRGTGLGLTISRQLMELHGGTIVLENRPGGGARVTIAFPAAV